MSNEKENPLVSVVIPTYKRPGMLGRAIDSVLNQTYDNIEIIVVDDNDEDSEYRKETEEFMEKYTDVDKLVYMKHKENKGGGLARNTGIENSRGEYIAFLDDDDEFLPKKIELQVDAFLNSDVNNLGLVYCGIEIRDENNNFKNHKGINAENQPLERHLIENIAPCPTIFTTKKLLDEINGFNDLNSGQEYDLILRILEKKKKVKYIDKYLVIVYEHGNERITNSKNFLNEIMRIYEQKKLFFKYVDDNIVEEIKYEHLRSLTEFYLSKGEKKKGFKLFIELLSVKKFKTRNLIIGFKLLIGRKIFNCIKEIFFKFKNSLRGFIKWL